MATKLLNCDEQDLHFSIKRRKYLKSMFFCVTPESLTPLAALMYQEFEKTWTCELPHETDNLQLRMVFLYEDEKKVLHKICCCNVHDICTLAGHPTLHLSICERTT